MLATPDATARARFADVCAHAFGFAQADAPSWFDRCGHDNLRIWEDGHAGLIYVPMGQFWGGRSVPMVGIAGVAVAPEHRGGGTATRLMRAAVTDLHRQGVALSTLYPATVPLYQRAGYERAGVRYQIELEARDLPSCRHGALRPLEGPEDPAMRAMYKAYARTRNGYLDRGPYVWGRIFKPFGTRHVNGFAVGEEGYLALIHDRNSEGENEVEVTDWVALSAAGGRRLLGLLADYRSVVRRIRWHGSAPDLFLLLLPERQHKITVGEYWMLRLVDLPAALAGRGYGPFDLSLDLEVTDDLIEANCGRWRLRLEGGQMTVERGGLGRFKTDIRALASLYTGFVPASTLVAAGLAEAPHDEQERATALFAGAAPATGDFF